MRRIKRLISMAAACLFAFAAVAAGTVTAKAATGTLVDLTGGNIHVTSMKNGTTDLLSGTDNEVVYDSTIFTTIEWSIPNNKVWTPGDEFTYQLPGGDQGLTFDDYTGDLENKSGKKGTYTIHDNVITIKYTDTGFCTVDDERTGLITFSGAFYHKGSEDPVEKKVNLTFPVSDKVSFTVKPQDKNSDLSVAKDFYDNDPVNHIYDCKITITSFSTNTNVILNDEMWPGMSLYTKPKYYSDPQCTVELPSSAFEDTTADPSESNRFVKAKFYNMGDKEAIYIKYQVKVHPDMYEKESAHALVDDDKYYPHTYGGNVPNKAAVKSDTVKDERVAWADIVTLRSYIGKWVYTDLEDYTHGLIGWDIAIPSIYNSPFSEPVTEGYIIDTLPLNSSFLPGSVVVKQEDQKTVIENPITVEEGPVDAKTGRKTVIIHFNPNLLNYLKSSENARAWMFYQTKVDTYDGNDFAAANDVEIFYNGTSCQKTGADTTYYGPSNVSKIVSYNEATAPYAFYNITVNPASFDLNSNGDTLTVVDEMCDSFDLVVSSVKIDDADPKPGEFDYDSDKRKMTFNLTDNEYHKITYKVTVNLAVGTEFTSSNSSNTATLNADNTQAGKYTSIIKGFVYKSSGYSSSLTDPRRIDVTKLDKDDKTKALSGAKFSLYTMVFDDSDNSVSLPDPEEKVTLTTKESGQVVFNDIVRGKIYMLVETKAPNGYNLDETPTFYAFESDKVNLPSQVKYSGKTYDLNISAATLAINSVNILDAKITDTPTPTPVAATLKIEKVVRGSNNLGEDKMKQIKITVNDENGKAVWSGTLGDTNAFQKGSDGKYNPKYTSEVITIPDISKNYTVTEVFTDVTNTVYLKVRYGLNTTDVTKYTVVDKDFNRDDLTTSKLTMNPGENTLYLENGYYVRDLKITKHTSGEGADKDKQFTIVAYLTPPAGKTIDWDNVIVVTNPSSGSNKPTYTIDRDANTITCNVANEQYVMLRRLPIGTTYVADEDLTGVIGYTLTEMEYCDKKHYVNDFDTGPDCIDAYNEYVKPTDTNTPTPTNTIAPTDTNTPTPTNTTAPTDTNTPTPTNTTAPTDTNTPTPTNTTAPTDTNTPTPTNTTALTDTNTPTPTNTTAPTDTNTPTPTNTTAPTPPADTETPTPTPDTPADTETPTPTPDTPADTETPTPTPEAPADTETPTPTPEATVTETPAPTAPADTETPTPKPTKKPTDTPVPTDTPAPTATNTPAPTNTATPAPTATPVPTATSTPVPTATSTPKPTATPKPTVKDDDTEPTPKPTSPAKIVIKNEGDNDDDTDNTKTVVIETTDGKKLPPLKIIDEDGNEVDVKVSEDGKKLTFKINEGDKVSVVDVSDGSYKITSVDKATKKKTEIKFKANDKKISDDNGKTTDGVYRLKDKTGKTALVATGEDLTNVYILTAVCFTVAAAAIVCRAVRFKKEDF